MVTPQPVGGRTAPKIVWKKESRAKPQVCTLQRFAADRGITAATFEPLIAIRRSAWAELRRHAQSATVEVGGILVGEVFQDPDTGQLLVDVHSAIPAMGAFGSGAYFKLTPEAWDHITRVRDQQFPTATYPHHLTVGWYHTHPGLGIFYSNTDRASQGAFFTQPWNFGIVVDPVRNNFGLFLGADSRELDRAHLVRYEDRPRQWTPVDQPIVTWQPEPRGPSISPARIWDQYRIAVSVVLVMLAIWLARRVREHGRRRV